MSGNYNENLETIDLSVSVSQGAEVLKIGEQTFFIKPAIFQVTFSCSYSSHIQVIILFLMVFQKIYY